MIKISIVDDHQVIIDGLTSLFQESDAIQVICTALNGYELLRSLEKGVRPDVVLLDMNMPELDGLETTKLVKEQNPDIKIIALTMHDSVTYVKKMVELGADGFILKNADKELIIRSIKRVFEGGTAFNNDLLTNLVLSERSEDEEAVDPKKRYKLTNRDLDVLRGIAKDMSNEDLAEHLGLSIHTIKTHRKNLLKKVGVRSSLGLVSFVYENNLLDTTD